MIDKESCAISGIVDGDQRKQGKLWKDKLMVYAPEELPGLNFDYIIVSLLKYGEIEKRCRELRIPDEKVISYWKDSESYGIFENRALRIIKEQHEKIIYENRLESAPYEWGLKPVPKIHSAESLLNKIKRERSSLCRFGDGEFDIMRGLDRPWFQKKSQGLKNKLIEVICSDISDINIGVAQNFVALDQYKEEDADSIRSYMSHGTRDDIFRFLDFKKVYYDAYVTRPYIIYKDKKHAEKIFKLFKEIWEKRDVVIVEGKYARNGIILSTEWICSKLISSFRRHPISFLDTKMCCRPLP